MPRKRKPPRPRPEVTAKDLAGFYANAFTLSPAAAAVVVLDPRADRVQVVADRTAPTGGAPWWAEAMPGSKAWLESRLA
jgi:hypothetical protein